MTNLSQLRTGISRLLVLFIVTSFLLAGCSASYRAKKGRISDEDFLDAMQDHFSNCSITDRIAETNSNGIHTDTIFFDATLESPYLTTYLSGYCYMEFIDDCWTETYDFWIVENDWSSFKDEFGYRNESLNLGAGFYIADVEVSISDIKQLDDSQLQLTYSANVYLFDQTGGYIAENEEILDKTTTIKIYNEKATILGKEIAIPHRARYISLPWYGTFALFLDHEIGVAATNNTSVGNAFAPFDRLISLDDLQDAMDKLEGMNP